MAETTYTLEKVVIGGVYYKLRVSVDADGINVNYAEKEMTLAAALATIHTEIVNLQNTIGNVEDLLKAI